MALLTLRYRPAPLCSYEACSSLSFVSVFLPFTFSDDSSDIQPSFLTDPAPHKLPLSCIGLETKTPHFYLPPPLIFLGFTVRGSVTVDMRVFQFLGLQIFPHISVCYILIRTMVNSIFSKKNPNVPHKDAEIKILYILQPSSNGEDSLGLLLS